MRTPAHRYVYPYYVAIGETLVCLYPYIYAVLLLIGSVQECDQLIALS